MSGRTTLIAALLALAAGPALAQEAISTAGATPMPASADTAAQIDRWIADGAPPTEAPAINEARKIHGEVGVSVGTGGYRSGYVVSTVPLGETGSLTMAISQTEFGDRGRHRAREVGPGLVRP